MWTVGRFRPNTSRNRHSYSSSLEGRSYPSFAPPFCPCSPPFPLPRPRLRPRPFLIFFISAFRASSLVSSDVRVWPDTSDRWGDRVVPSRVDWRTFWGSAKKKTGFQGQIPVLQKESWFVCLGRLTFIEAFWIGRPECALGT